MAVHALICFRYRKSRTTLRSVCIVQNRLFCIKSVHAIGFNKAVTPPPTLCIYDLDKQVVIKEFDTESEGRIFSNLVANEHYAAWEERDDCIFRSASRNIKCLDIANEKLWTVEITNGDFEIRDLEMDLFENLLSISYTPIPNFRLIIKDNAHRLVIDMPTGKIFVMFNIGTMQFPSKTDRFSLQVEVSLTHKCT